MRRDLLNHPPNFPGQPCARGEGVCARNGHARRPAAQQRRASAAPGLRRTARARGRRSDRRELRARRGRLDASRPKTLWPGGGKAWLVEAYFGFAPDEEALRELVAVAAGEDAARRVEFGLTEKRDWVANSLAGLAPVRAGRFLVHGAHDRARVGQRRGIEIEAGLAFGTGHHGTTRGCLLHFDRVLKRRRPRAFSTSAAAPACSPSPRPRFSSAGSARRHRCDRRRGRRRQRALNGVAASCRAIVSRGVENRALRDGGPTTSCSPTFSPSRCACSRPRSPP